MTVIACKKITGILFAVFFHLSLALRRTLGGGFRWSDAEDENARGIGSQRAPDILADCATTVPFDASPPRIDDNY